MPIVLEVIAGEQKGLEIAIGDGESVRVGKDTGLADCVFPLDPSMSLVHATAGCDDGGGWVRDLNSLAGTYVNDVRVAQARIAPGDTLRVGDTVFQVQAAPRETPVTTEPALSDDTVPEPVQRLLDLLRREPLSLFAVLDAARAPSVVALLRESRAAMQSLFEGEPAEELAPVAPYLVALEKDSALLRKLLSDGWGDSRGVLLTSAAGLQQVRTHLRQFLLVQDDRGNQQYFRFYDPRVLRVYLPTCNAAETQQFFGPIDRFIVEDGPELALWFLPDERPQLSVTVLAP